MFTSYKHVPFISSIPKSIAAVLRSFLNIVFLIERTLLWCHTRHENSTSQADKGSRWLSCSDGLLHVTETWGPLRLVLGGIQEWEVNDQNILGHH